MSSRPTSPKRSSTSRRPPAPRRAPATSSTSTAASRSPIPGRGLVRVGLFVTCLGDTLFPEAPQAVVRVLERLGHEVAFPAEQTCCGQLHANSGYRDEALALAARFERIFEGFEAIVSPSSSFVGMIRELRPALVGRVFEFSE